jgi:hypothetical protein
MLALLFGCQTQTRVYVTEAPSDQAKFNKILVLSFNWVPFSVGAGVG